MNLLRFTIGDRIFSIRSDRILRIIGGIDLIENKTKIQKKSAESGNSNIKIYNLTKLFNLNLQNGRRENSRIIFLKGFSNPYGILVDEILNIGEGIIREVNTLVSLKKGINPELIEGFEIVGEEVSIVLNCDLIMELLG